MITVQISVDTARLVLAALQDYRFRLRKQAERLGSSPDVDAVNLKMSAVHLAMKIFADALRG